MNKKQLISIAFVSALISAGSVGVVSAQSECTTIEELTEDCEVDRGVLDTASDFAHSASGFVERVSSSVSPFSDTAESEQVMSEFTTQINESEGTESWLNERISQSLITDDETVVEVRGTDDEGNEASTYIFIDFDADGDVQNLSASDTTDKEVDFTEEIDSFAVENINDEFDSLHSEYVGSNEDIDRSETSRLAGAYGCSIDSELANKSGDSFTLCR